ncbi:hypothetical protein DS742_18115 [Lacrimispora amygdalina]|uniref:Flagellar export protein FliJ n=1 Tax=Lacrimispora amygdalina TaxID=253257 RepID=A0A3E2N9A9_9FIRM|nr:hypothetical protein [Clostridium indicum]RFZ77471.1 hypothetical protein DS742_18115 [Clostridium indicum]
MPRGRKHPQNIDEQIVETEEQIKKLQEKRKQLIADKKKEDIETLLHAAREAGITPAELVAKLASSKNSDT